MNIEFFVPARETEDWLLDHIKQKLMEFHHQFKNISRAAVYLKQGNDNARNEHSCKIDLTIFGSSIEVHSNAENYQHAVREVLSELEKRVADQVQRQKDLPDDLYSSIRV